MIRFSVVRLKTPDSPSSDTVRLKRPARRTAALRRKLARHWGNASRFFVRLSAVVVRHVGNFLHELSVLAWFLLFVLLEGLMVYGLFRLVGPR